MKEHHKAVVFVISLMGIYILTCYGSYLLDIINGKGAKENIEVENNKEEENEDAKYTPSYIGTFEFEKLVSWSLTLKEDGTGTLIGKFGGVSEIHYISYDYRDGCLWCDISGNSITMYFEGMKDEYMGSFIIDIDELYIYDDISAYNAKNPQLRLKMKKI